MNRTLRAAVAALMLAVGFAGSVAAGPLEDSAAAYERGDDGTASRLLRRLAEQGNADAQARLTLIDADAAYKKATTQRRCDCCVPLPSGAAPTLKLFSGSCVPTAGASRRTTRLR
jgi:hypothetical protein